MDGQCSGGSSLGYYIGVSVGAFFLIMVTTFAWYLYIRIRSPDDDDHHDSQRSSDDQDSVTVELAGLDEATTLTYPKLLYSEAKLHVNGDSTGLIYCSICLADYKETDMLRLLPDCGHLFHLQCIDAWLRLHPKCPVCRNSLVSTPPVAPAAAEAVVPLAMR
ncbi:hypothetical protein L1049_010949 [Liquidambar formosana]|uniref:RING-type E3 ubiquitin transferase n=1 Tax=Liquidambar formosana TaxID=63359 RepID=A0AAP0WWP9_LIQFO